MTPRSLFGPLITVTVTIVLAVIGATWHLSNQIGDLRVAIQAEHGENARLGDKVNTMWAAFIARDMKGEAWTSPR